MVVCPVLVLEFLRNVNSFVLLPFIDVPGEWFLRFCQSPCLSKKVTDCLFGVCWKQSLNHTTQARLR